MKNLLFLFLFSFLSNWILTLHAQVMHSSSAMEYSMGIEGFSQYIASEVESGGQEIIQDNPEIYRQRPILTARYKKYKGNGNYIGIGAYLGWSRWRDAVSISGRTLGTIINSTELNEEGTLGLFYQHSFLVNRKGKRGFQFFIGMGTSLFRNEANKSMRHARIRPDIMRKIIGINISTIPEFAYFIPNSRIILSIRANIPIFGLERVNEDLRQASFSSFSRIVVVNNNFLLAPIESSRFELGFGYFLVSK